MATEYISREAALSMPWANGQYDHEHANEHFICGLETYKEWLEQIPAADVVEVVRCKDCRYFHNGYDEKCCINHKGVVVTDENGFCHHAERMADDG